MLSRLDEPIALQPQPARLLALLVERQGEVVCRDEIRDELWPGGVFLDHEQAINFAIRRIRMALEDDAKAPRFIETIPRVGYRFMAPVEPLETAAEEAAEDELARRSEIALEGYGEMGVSSGTPAIILDRAGIEPGDQVESVRESAGVTEGARRPSKILVSRRAQIGVWAFTILLLSSWVWTLRENSNGAAAKPGVISEDFAAEPVALGSRDGGAAEMAQPVPDDYLQGTYLVQQDSSEQIQEGLAKLRRVVQQQPDFAPAHVALATGLWRQGRARNHFSSFMPQMETSAKRALELSSDQPQALFLLALVQHFYHHDWDAAEATMRRALEIDPEDTETLQLLAMIRSSRGHSAEGVELLRRALALDPTAPWLRSDLTYVLMYDRRFREALENIADGLEVAPESWTLLWLDGSLRLHLGDREGALESLRRYRALRGRSAPETIEEILDALIEDGEKNRLQGRRAHWPLAVTHVLRGNAAEALTMLIEACEHDPDWELPTVGVDPRFDPVRELPGYARLADCVPNLR